MEEAPTLIFFLLSHLHFFMITCDFYNKKQCISERCAQRSEVTCPRLTAREDQAAPRVPSSMGREAHGGRDPAPKEPISALKMPLATTRRAVTIPSPTSAPPPASASTLGWEGPTYKALV